MWRLHSPFNLLIIISLVLTSSSSHTVPASNSEKSALLEFKSSVSDPTGLLTSWNSTGSDHCSWIGVTCESNSRVSRVVALNITGGGNSGDFTCSMYSQFPLYGFGIRKDCVDGNGKLVGKLSSSISKLRELRILSLPFNDLSGEIPVEIWGMEKLEVIDLEGNLINLINWKLQSRFTGLTSLRVLNLGFNHITGEIPDCLSEIKRLQILNLAGNRFNGSVPRFLDEFGDLRGLYLSFNQLSGYIPNEIGYNCGNLEYLELAGNLLVGRIPNSLGNCTKLQSVLLYSNLLQERIPIELGNLEALRVLDLSRNSLSGAIPREIGSCLNLSVLVLSNLMNPIPDFYGSVDGLTQLGREDEFNYFEGVIPSEITTLPNLQLLWAPRMRLGGPFPSNWGACASLEIVNLAQNLFVGEISKGLNVCKKLHYLDLSSNSLTGGISDELGVPCMTVFDVSGNHLSGSILSFRRTRCEPFRPSTAYLRYFLSKDIRTPSLISLAKSTSDQPVGNDFANLSGQPVSTRRGRWLTSTEIASMTRVPAVFAVMLALMVLFLCTDWRPKPVPQARGSVRKEVTLFTNIGVPLTFENVVRSTGSFNASNCIGSGGFGATYKAEISPGFLVAIKRLSVGRFQGVQQFDAEIKTLGLLRHLNLVTLIGYHSSETERFLIYNYLPGGNLERFIQERLARAADWRILHKIALGVARALAYLHDQCVPRVIHRDVKPSNILLDNDFNAYLSDFGLARILGTLQTHATTGVAGTFGYLAPEYALTSRVSDKADVYSYGVVLLELISDKKLLDPSFSSYGNGFNIVGWACMLLREGRAKDFFAEGLWDAGPKDDLVEVLQLAVVCTEDSPSPRPTMQQVVQRLKQLKPPPC